MNLDIGARPLGVRCNPTNLHIPTTARVRERTAKRHESADPCTNTSCATSTDTNLYIGVVPFHTLINVPTNVGTSGVDVRLRMSAPLRITVREMEERNEGTNGVYVSF